MADYLDTLKGLWNAVRPAQVSDWPQMESTIATAQAKIPGAEDVKFRPMNWFEKWARPEAAAMHWSFLPWQNTVAYDQERAQKAGLTPAELLTHELSHSQQRSKMGYLPYMKAGWTEGGMPYGSGPLESEALTAEKKPFMSQKDIILGGLKNVR